MHRTSSMSIVVIGGIGTMEGPIIGVAIFYLLQYYLATLGSWYLVLLGTLAILLMLFAPAGVWGVISGLFAIASCRRTSSFMP